MEEIPSGEELRKKLFNVKENGWEKSTAEQREKMFAFADEYMYFLRKRKKPGHLPSAANAADRDFSALVTKKSLSVFCLNTKTKTKPERNNPELTGFTTDRNQISP